MRKKQHNNLILRLKVGDPTSQTDFEKPEQEGHAKATHTPVDGVAGLAQIVSAPVCTIGETRPSKMASRRKSVMTTANRENNNTARPETEKEVYVNDAKGRHSTTAARNDRC